MMKSMEERLEDLLNEEFGERRVLEEYREDGELEVSVEAPYWDGDEDSIPDEMWLEEPDEDDEDAEDEYRAQLEEMRSWTCYHTVTVELDDDGWVEGFGISDTVSGGDGLGDYDPEDHFTEKEYIDSILEALREYFSDDPADDYDDEEDEEEEDEEPPTLEEAAAGYGFAMDDINHDIWQYRPETKQKILDDVLGKCGLSEEMFRARLEDVVKHMAKSKKLSTEDPDRLLQGLIDDYGFEGSEWDEAPKYAMLPRPMQTVSVFYLLSTLCVSVKGGTYVLGDDCGGGTELLDALETIGFSPDHWAVNTGAHGHDSYGMYTLDWRKEWDD